MGAVYDAHCADGEWVCPDRYPFTTADCIEYECSCEELPKWPGDACDSNGEMVCRITDEVIESWCDRMIVCTTCNGFDGPILIDGCGCHCNENGQVVCNREADQTGP